MIEEIEAYERNNDVINSICVYDVIKSKFIYNEDLVNNQSSIKAMIDNSCFDIPGFLYLKKIESHFFIAYNNYFIIFSDLKKKSNFNKVILEHKTSDFLQLLSIPN